MLQISLEYLLLLLSAVNATQAPIRFSVLAICFAVFGFKHKPKIVTRKFECMKKGTLIDSRTIKQFLAI